VNDNTREFLRQRKYDVTVTVTPNNVNVPPEFGVRVHDLPVQYQASQARKWK
jgi:hypothetical protein